MLENEKKTYLRIKIRNRRIEIIIAKIKKIK